MAMGRAGTKARRLERFNDLKRRKNAVAAVKLPGIDNGINVRAEHEWRGVGAALRRPDTKKISNVIGHDRETGLAHPAGHEIAPRLILIRGCEAGAATVGIKTDRAKRVDTLQKTFFVDDQHSLLPSASNYRFYSVMIPVYGIKKANSIRYQTKTVLFCFSAAKECGRIEKKGAREWLYHFRNARACRANFI